MRQDIFRIIRNQLENNLPARLNIELDEESFFIDWRINIQCNLSCEYCFFDDKTRKESFLDEAVVEKVIELVNISSKHYILNICGGEPFFNNNIIQVFKELTQKNDIIIGTNLTCNNIYEFADTVSIHRVPFILASFHHLALSDNQKEDFFKRFLYLQNKGFNIVFGILNYPVDENKEIIRLIGNALEKGVRFITIKTFIGEFKGRKYPKHYSRKNIEFIKKYATLEQEVNIAKCNFNMFKKNCIAGLNYFHLSPNGAIRNCDVIRNDLTNIKNLSSFEELIADGRSTFCKEKICYCLWTFT